MIDKKCFIDIRQFELVFYLNFLIKQACMKCKMFNYE